MSQHWEDRNGEDQRAIERVMRGVDSREARRMRHLDRAVDLAIVVLIVALFWAAAGCPRIW